MKLTKQFFNMKNTYGILFALKAIIIRFFSKEKYNRYIFKKLNSIYGPMVKDYCSNDVQDGKNSGIIPIWLFWWQGINNAPEIVKKCIESVKKNFDDRTYKIIFIDKSNIHEICQFPDYIYEKIDKKIITLTHFSDLIRADLLYRYGGLWIDATIYVTKNVPFNYFANYDFFTLVSEKSNRIINGRWTGFFMYSTKGYALWHFMYNAFLHYWKKHNSLVAYLLIDFLIAVFFENSNDFRNDLENINFSNIHLWSLMRKLNLPFDQGQMERVLSDTYFLKLSYKDEINNGPLKDYLDDRMTFWGYLKNIES